MRRPTLEEQIQVSKVTDEELIETLAPSKGWQGLNFWFFCHAKLLWRVIHWNWLEVMKG